MRASAGLRWSTGGASNAQTILQASLGQLESSAKRAMVAYCRPVGNELVPPGRGAQVMRARCCVTDDSTARMLKRAAAKLPGPACEFKCRGGPITDAERSPAARPPK